MNNEVKMEQKNKLIPELRFLEFVKDGEWHRKELNEILDYERPDNYIVADTNYENSGTPVLTANKSFVLGYTNEKFGIYNNLPVIIFDDFTVDNKYVYFPFKVKSSAIKILKNKGDDNLKFIYELMTQINFNAIEHKRYYISEYQNLSVYVPKSNEQQKIADCLTSLDEVITAHQDKLEALKNHKKGLLQNLFPQEGQKVPNHRFPEFLNDGEWKPTTVDNNCNVKGRIGFRGYTKEDLVSKEKGVFVIGGKHIQNQMLDLSDPTYLSWDKYYESPEIMVELNDIVFSQRGTLGDCAIIDKEIGEATINPSMVLLKKIKCNPRFLYYILIGEKIQNEVAKNRTSAAIPMLSQKQIKEFSFQIPSPSEQQKIADCLVDVDNLITAQREKLEQLKVHKKGLMQGLFPKID